MQLLDFKFNYYAQIQMANMMSVGACDSAPNSLSSSYMKKPITVGLHSGNIDFKFDLLWKEVTNPDYIELTGKEMEQIRIYLTSEDLDSFKLGIQMLNQRRIPLSIDNILIVQDALRAYMRLIYEQ